MTLTNSINLPGLAHYSPSNSPNGTVVFNRKDGHTYVTQRGLWICVTGDQGVMPMIPKKSRIRRVLQVIKSIFF